VHPEDRGRARERFLEANNARAPFALEHRLRTRTGEYRWVMDAGRPRFGRDGSLLGYVGAVTDIHDRVLAEQSLRASRDRLDLVVASGEIGLWWCDLPFDELDWSPRVKSHFGLPADARVTIDTFWERMHPDDREHTRSAIERAVEERAPYDVEYRTVGLDGRIRWIRAIGQASHDAAGVARSFNGITIDVTERVQLLEQLREADRRKDEFLAVLAHELRNPLAPIANGLQLLELVSDDPGAAARARRSMQRQLRHLVRLVDDLLDVSRISRGKLELRRAPMRLADAVAQAVELARPALEASAHRFTVSVPEEEVVIEGDETRIAQAISNLIHNAAKFTPPGGSVTVRASASDSAVEVRVRDSGVGIASEMLARIFDLFVQVPAGAQQHGGLGIGLSLARMFAALHGGSLRAESAGPGLGAEFILTLPRAGAPLWTMAAEPDSGRADRPLRALVVDDNREAADTFVEVLRARGHEVAVAYDGLEALQQVERVQPAIVFLDLGMPRMDGYDVAMRLREREGRPCPTLVAVTGWGQEQARQRSSAAGFDAHLVKPVTEAQIAEAVRIASDRIQSTA
jgi:PAS domain S-box-containing protein